MGSILALFARPRGSWLGVLLWMGLLVLAFALSGALETRLRDDPTSYLARGSDSLRVFEAQEAFPGGARASGVIVAESTTGTLTDAQTERLQSLGAELAGDRSVRVEPLRVSADGRAAAIVVSLPDANDTPALVARVTDIRERMARAGQGDLGLHLTGPAGNRTDLEAVFDQIDGTLLTATAILVLVLLVLIYRSPIFWIIPFVTATVAIIVARGACAVAADAGLVINDQSANILPVLLFGAGTDYALLVVSRYREALQAREDRRAALAEAVRHAGPTVVVSAFTTGVALATLLLSQLSGTVGLAAVGVIGVAVVMLAMVTLLPALLGLVGRWAFWPFVPRVQKTGADPAERGVWAAVGRLVARAPVMTTALAGGALAVAALGLLGLDTRLHRANGFIDENQTTLGYRLLERHFPAGLGTPAIVVVRGGGASVEAVRVRLAGDARLELGPVETVGPAARFAVTFPEPPFSEAGFARLEALRAQTAGQPVLIGGSTAEEVDVRAAARADELLILPLVLAAVGLVLLALLRSVVAPLVLLGTVALSFAASLGISDLLFTTAFGFEGTEPTVPLFAFVFLVALGIDYNIFLVARIREEAGARPLQDAIGRGLARTGGVITAAGLVLAATFAVLATLPTGVLIQVGFTVALGLLIDTFVVRTLLVPALLHLAGRRAWWPSSGPRTTPM